MSKNECAVPPEGYIFSIPPSYEESFDHNEVAIVSTLKSESSTLILCPSICLRHNQLSDKNSEYNQLSKIHGILWCAML